MRALAEYAMRGRRQATLATLIISVIPIVNLLAPALIGLVCLRHGLREALQVLIWAILPLIGWAMVGDVTPLVLTLGVLAMSTVLRSSNDWQTTLIAAIVVGVAAEMLLRLRPEFMAAIMTQLEGMMAAENVDAGMDELQRVMFMLFGVVHMLLAICLTMVSRWWQGLLYNPGGFGEEFRRLRFQPKVGFTLAVLFLVASFGVPVLAGWVLYFVMPLLFAGLALLHGVARIKGWPTPALAGIYVLLVLLNPLSAQLIIAAALVDSWYDFRSRLQAAGPGE